MCVSHINIGLQAIIGSQSKEGFLTQLIAKITSPFRVGLVRKGAPVPEPSNHRVSGGGRAETRLPSASRHYSKRFVRPNLAEETV